MTFLAEALTKGRATGFVSSTASHSRSSKLRTTSAIMMPLAAHLVFSIFRRSSGGTDTGNFFIFSFLFVHLA